MRLTTLILAATLASTLCFAQTPTPAPAPTPPAPVVQPDSDPTAETTDPTLLRAQIMIADNAQEAARRVLSPLQDFKEYERFGDLAAAKRQRLQAILQQRAANQTGELQSKSHQQDKNNMKDEMAKIAKANDEKNKAAAAAKAKQ